MKRTGLEVTHNRYFGDGCGCPMAILCVAAIGKDALDHNDIVCKWASDEFGYDQFGCYATGFDLPPTDEDPPMYQHKLFYFAGRAARRELIPK